MRLAYILSAYKYPEQFIRLIRRLHTESSSFFIHFDKKADPAVFDQAVRGVKDLRDVYFLSNRYRCNWGGFGHVQATLAGIHEIFKRDVPFDYAILLTGQDYPIKTNAEILDFFTQSQGCSYLDFFPLPHAEWQNGGLDRINSWHLRFSKRHIVFPGTQRFLFQRKFPAGYQPFGGSSYWCLSWECIKTVYETIQLNPGLVNFFRWVDVPDELFFQTILVNSCMKESIVNDDLRYIVWKDAKAGSPAILKEDDFDKMVQSPKLFARKFDMTVDAEVLDTIDRALVAKG